MKPLGRFALTAVSLLILAAIFFTVPAVAQQKSIKEQLVGTWTLVSAISVSSDGRKTEAFGPNPKGTIIYTSDGHFALVQMRADPPASASGTRAQGTPENRPAGQGSIAYFGRYSVNEAEKVMTLQIEGSTSANVGAGEEKRIITFLSADELKFANPRPNGSTLEVASKRAK